MITDELREWLENAYSYGTGENLFKKNYSPGFGWKPVLEPMLDRIDAEHESKVSYWQETSYKDGYDEGFASADDYFTDKRETLEEHGWVKLPVDADGVPIHVGDVVTMQLLFGGESKPLVVDRMELSHGRDGDLWCVALDTDKECWNQPSLMRHYTPPTVEDVLREFASDIADVLGGDDFRLEDNDELFAEYAAKLRLAGEGE